MYTMFIMKLFKSKISKDLLIVAIAISGIYLGFFFGINAQVNQDKKFLIQARKNLNSFSCNLQPDRTDFYKEKLALLEEQVNNTTKLEHILIIPYIYQTGFKKIDSETISIPNFSASMGSEPTLEKKYSLNDLREFIDEEWNTDYSTILNFRKC